MENQQNQQEEQNIPTKEELVAFLQEQIDVKKLQVELQSLNTQLAEGRATEIKALSFIAQMTNPQKVSETDDSKSETPVRTLKKEKNNGNS